MNRPNQAHGSKFGLKFGLLLNTQLNLITFFSVAVVVTRELFVEGVMASTSDNDDSTLLKTSVRKETRYYVQGLLHCSVSC